MNYIDIKVKAEKAWLNWNSNDRPRILVGMATCGKAAGADAVLESLRRSITERRVEIPVTGVGCIGLCYAEPLVDIIYPEIGRVCYSNVNPESAASLVDSAINGIVLDDKVLGYIDKGKSKDIKAVSLFDQPVMKQQVRRILRNCGFIDPEKVEHYIARGGYGGLARALTMKPETVLEELKQSGLRGRGGAGFPTWQKWKFCRDAIGDEKYLICNADEGDPGAFMNRSLLEGDPHSVLEGMVIGAWVIGAKHGYIYCRAEYPLALERLRLAISQMRELSLIGNNILGSGLNFDITVKEGAGAFVCGEETALMQSIEGRRGMPRPRPPFPALAGLWGKPTNINNVESWAASALIMQESGQKYAEIGTPLSRGTKTFSLVGKVERTGLIEVPLGIKLRDVIYEVGGGILGGKQFKAVQTGGPSGGCLPASMLDQPVDYETLASAGSIMGSGGMIVMDEDTCMVDLARYFLNFTQSESCGKCVPCRVGTRQMLAVLQRITQGKGEEEDILQLERLSDTIRKGSLCGLGQTAPNPVLTTLRHFRSEYEAHVREKRCPALVCKGLISFFILPDKCQGCMRCLRSCPVEAIKGSKRMVHVIDQAKCEKCGACLEICPKRFSAVKKVSGSKINVPAEPIPVTASEAA
jgi:NADH:ubiquinone oxidoreductase subunit F (NADH-binding)/NAD-dependent dihydropyrimidine dehydrogenase PreA subunit/(2Fe-2S) ferredoxin